MDETLRQLGIMFRTGLEPRPMLYLVHCNGDLLGDKIVLSALVRLLRRDPTVELIGVEGGECLSMSQYLVPPSKVVRHTMISRHESLWSASSAGIAAMDKNSLPLSHYLRTRTTQYPLWELVRVAAQVGCPPAIRPLHKERALAITDGVSRDVVLHVRTLTRNKNRNSDMRLLHDVLRQLTSVGYECLVIGDDSENVRGLVMELPTVRFELGRLPFERLVAIVQSAEVFIGGDSGPRHLATALGRPVICLGEWNRRFGPFPVFPGQVVTAANASEALGCVNRFRQLPIAA